MLPEFRTLLHPTDLSERDRDVAGYVFALARSLGAQVVLLHVVEPVPERTLTLVQQFLPPDAPDADTIRVEGLRRMRAETQQLVEELLAREAVTGVEVTVHIAEGMPAPSILTAARDFNADLIVMGTRGRSVVGEMLGSVAHKVVHQAHVPVTLVPLRKNQ